MKLKNKLVTLGLIGAISISSYFCSREPKYTKPSEITQEQILSEPYNIKEEEKDILLVIGCTSPKGIIKAGNSEGRYNINPHYNIKSNDTVMNDINRLYNLCENEGSEYQFSYDAYLFQKVKGLSLPAHKLELSKDHSNPQELIEDIERIRIKYINSGIEKEKPKNKSDDVCSDYIGNKDAFVYFEFGCIDADGTREIGTNLSIEALANPNFIRSPIYFNGYSKVCEDKGKKLYYSVYCGLRTDGNIEKMEKELIFENKNANDEGFIRDLERARIVERRIKNEL